MLNEAYTSKNMIEKNHLIMSAFSRPSMSQYSLGEACERTAYHAMKR